MSDELYEILNGLFGKIDNVDFRELFKNGDLKKYEENKYIITEHINKEEIILRKIYPDYCNDITGRKLEEIIKSLEQATILFEVKEQFFYYIILADRELISKAIYHLFLKNKRNYKIYKILNNL